MFVRATCKTHCFCDRAIPVRRLRKFCSQRPPARRERARAAVARVTRCLGDRSRSSGVLRCGARRGARRRSFVCHAGHCSVGALLAVVGGRLVRHSIFGHCGLRLKGYLCVKLRARRETCSNRLRFFRKISLLVSYSPLAVGCFLRGAAVVHGARRGCLLVWM